MSDAKTLTKSTYLPDEQVIHSYSVVHKVDTSGQYDVQSIPSGYDGKTRD